ncbi:interleukin-1 receptor-associated kinase 1 isoform X2 [Anguilla anguilla]|uniref:interleukin-1 receptor-associated kinase 1 isoform X2 n=1 Tax=Anguilla anguilla TaxID=7936 RepID=UPI0015AB31CD|nr:interleukin-1 receptor-associated kinase 1 isoform X2 [Anguilla anguilla]
MSDWNIENEYLYKLPPAILYEFNKVMDCLPNSDWDRFASRVVRDQTDLRQSARKERRTDVVMQLWGDRNGTVGELLSLLAELQLLRARDIILRWSPVRPSPEMASNNVHISCKSFPPSPSKENLEDNQETRPFIERAPKPLPKPGPPPSGLESREKMESITAPQSACLSNTPGKNIPQSHNAMCWPFEEVQCGTNNFTEALQIGEGGFGRVYRATLRNTEYAVKRLKQDSRLNWPLMRESFRTEVEKLSQYRHPNIVEFAGYCVGGGEHCLLYPFMSNGCLDERLHGPSSAALSWTERVSVLLGSARAIQFLHSSCPPLIHGDVKSSNILLGDHLEPKLGDFGLARFYQSPRRTAGRTSSVAQTKTVRGTLAYLPDEYVKKGELGVEIDTYSFGVVILEVLTGRRALETDSQSRTVYLKDLVSEGEEEKEEEEEGGSTASSLGCLPSSAAKHISKKHLDPQLAPAASQWSLDLSSLACRCLDRRKKKRPPMIDVYKVIEDLHSRLQSSSLEFSTHEASSTLLDQSPPTAPSPAPPPAPLLQSLDSIMHGLAKLVPQEDTYYCPVSSLSSLPPPQTLSSQRPGTHVGSWGPDPPSSQTPCESDDSLGDLRYFSSDPSVLSPPSGDYRGALQSCSLSGRSSAESGTSRGGAKTDTSHSSSQSDMASDKIVMNAVKQRFVQKMAMYKEGKIPISALLSSDDLSCGDASNKSQEPEESEFECSPGEAFGTNNSKKT